MNNVAITLNFIKKLGLEHDFYNLPYDLKIATITLTCKLDTAINVQNIGHYMNLNKNDVVCVKYGPDKIIRSLIQLKKNYNSAGKKKKNFQNQVSLMIKIKNDRNIHVKLFSNGTMQITGCKTVCNFVEMMRILCRKLLEVKFTYNIITKQTVKKTFISEPDNIKVEKISDLKIRMINSNFHVGFMIDRVILYKLLLEKGYECNYDQCSHAAVNLKYKCDNDEISIFIFESGSIIITGVKNKIHINESYNFIVTFLHDNYNIIAKHDIDKFLQRPDIKKLIADDL